MALLKVQQASEGEIFCKWLHRRLIVNNKNVLGVELGGTGSGKSYRDLRKAQLWYQYHFKEDFPIKNICFGVSQVMDRLTSKEMRRGEVLIFEEAGVALGALDFQNKVSKMFNYILQSFRSMNVAIFFNLPHQGMLNKTARTLLHYSFESNGIDFENKLNNCKPKFNQVDQSTGKIYRKYMKVNNNGKITKIKNFSFSIPDEYLIKAYEDYKLKYITDLADGFQTHLRNEEQELKDKMGRPTLVDKQKRVHELLKIGLRTSEIAEKLNILPSDVSHTKKAIKKKGFETNFERNIKEIEKLEVMNQPISTTI
jgi:hypothetical protein